MSRGPRRHTTRPPLGTRHQPWQPDSEDDFCRRCGASIRWAWTEKNAKQPIDPDDADRDDEAATLAVWRNPLRRLCVRTITAERPLLGFEHRAMPHFATCPPMVAEREAKRAAREARAAAAAAVPPVTERRRPSTTCPTSTRRSPGRIRPACTPRRCRRRRCSSTTATSGRVRRMAAAWDQRMVGVLDVADRGPQPEDRPRYAVVNGQHRWAAAIEARGADVWLACTVHEGLDVPGEARLMHELDRTTRKLSGHDQWRARRGAGDPAVLAIDRIAAAHGLRVGPQLADGVLRAYGAAEKLLQQGGEQLLDATLAVLRGAYGLTAAAWQAPLVTAVGSLLREYPTLDVDRLTRALAATTPTQLRSTATTLREVEPGTLAQLMSRAIAGVYNRTDGQGGRIAGGRA